MTIGQRIAEKRKEAGLSQEALGEKLGVSRQSVYKWESDAAMPEIDKLVAMSRLFSVTVGWLLGVEDAPEGETPREESGELSEEQARLVEEIVGRYIAMSRPRKKRRWPWLLAAAAAVVLVVKITDLSGQLDTLNSRYNSLQNSISGINSSVSGQMNRMTERMEEILQSQNSLLADYDVAVTGCSVPEGELYLAAHATPKTYVPGMAVLFVADTGEGLEEFAAREEPGHRFSADIACALTDKTTVSVVLVTGDTRETQVLFAQTGYLASTYPVVMADGHFLMWHAVTKEGNLQFSVMGTDYAYMRESEYADWSDSITRAEVSEYKVGLFKNKKLLAWLEPVEGVPDSFQGDWSDTLFFRVPTMTVPVGEEDVFCLATLVVDEFGREKLYPDMAYGLDEERGELFWADEKVTDEDDWYDESTWSW